jgi:hypothetical protein
VGSTIISLQNQSHEHQGMPTEQISETRNVVNVRDSDDFDFETQFETTIDGDMNAKFAVGTLLYFKLTDSQLP